MDKNLIENIVSDCGYQALGLYEYLYCNKDEKYNVTVISMYQMVNEGAYRNEDALVESIEELKGFGYLAVMDNIYLFPKSIKNYDAFFKLIESVEKFEDPDELLSTLKDEDVQLIKKMYKSKKWDMLFKNTDRRKR